MKKYTIGIFAFLIAAALIGFYSTTIVLYKRTQSGHGKVSYTVNNIDDLVHDSDYIIECTAYGKQQIFKYDDIICIKTQLIVRKSIKGNLKNDQKITLLQTNIEEDPKMGIFEHALLFLEKYNGPIIKNAYVCKGLYQGHYKIKSSRIYNSLNNSLMSNSGLFKSFNSDNIDDVLNLLKEKVNSNKGSVK